MSFHYVALDLETTGLDPAKDEIIEVGAVRFSTEGELSTFETLINPGRPIPSQITQLTGISDRDVTTAPRFPRVRDKLTGFIGDAAVVGHNIRFDLFFQKKNKNPSYRSETNPGTLCGKKKTDYSRKRKKNWSEVEESGTIV